MNLTKKNSWNNAHIYFFYLFLFSIPFQTRKVFLTEHSFYSDAFMEYATFFVYISDILLSLTLIFWLVFNKKLYKRLNIESLKNARKLSAVWLLLFALIIWLIISAIINNGYVEISVFYILKFVELSLLFVYIYFNLKNKKRLIAALFIISLTGFFQGLIAIYQFIWQCPLFKHPLLHKLTGESTVYPQLPGIAKIIVDNEKLVRAYGTFPHPNLLGGFLVISILVSIYFLLKHKDYVLSRVSFKYNNINSDESQAKSVSLLLSLFWVILIFTQITALLFTFSRTAWIGFLISLFLAVMFYIHYLLIVSHETISKNYFSTNKNNPFANKQILKNSPLERGRLRSRRGVFKKLHDYNLKLNKIVSRETISENLNMTELHRYYRLSCRLKEFIVIILLTLALIIIYSHHINSRISEELSADNSLFSDQLPSNYAFDDRIFYNNVSRETISENFILGSGPGTFIFQINGYLTKNNIYQKPEPWQYQPAHNIYLLIISEIGIVGFIIFVLFIIKVITRNNNFRTSSFLCHFEPVRVRNLWILLYRNNMYIKTAFRSLNRSAHFEMTKSEEVLNNKNNKIVSRETIEEDLSRELNYYLLSILAAFLFIGLFDHYFWTLQQGRLMFWLVLGLMLVNSRNSRK